MSAQKRKRYFWTNIPFTLPEDKNIVLQSILQKDVDAKYFSKKCIVTGEYKKDTFILMSSIGRRYDKDGKRCDNDKTVEYQQRVAPKTDQTKCGTLTSVTKDNLIYINNRIRRLTPIECERLMGLADNYTNMIAETKRYKCCGNAFNCDVVAHIFSFVL